MTLYKFKSLRNFEFVSDIICNKRFYAASFLDLNDPMEGQFYHDPETKREFLDEIYMGKLRLKICSFSKDFGNLLLWAHYSDSFRGICFEVEVDPHVSHEIVEIDYSTFTVAVSNESTGREYDLPKRILSVKYEDWKYEEEVRLISNEQYITRGIKLKAIHLGLRTPDILKETIFRLAPRNVLINETEICEATSRVKVKGEYLETKTLPARRR